MIQRMYNSYRSMWYSGHAV